MSRYLAAFRAEDAESCFSGSPVSNKSEKAKTLPASDPGTAARPAGEGFRLIRDIRDHTFNETHFLGDAADGALRDALAADTPPLVFRPTLSPASPEQAADEAADRAAIAAEPLLPAPGTAARERMDRHRAETVAGCWQGSARTAGRDLISAGETADSWESRIGDGLIRRAEEL
jgi:hypothetical protein